MGFFSSLFGGSTKVNQTTTTTAKTDVDVTVENNLDISPVAKAMAWLGLIDVQAQQQKLIADKQRSLIDQETAKLNSATSMLNTNKLIEFGKDAITVSLIAGGGYWLFKKGKK